MVKRGRYGVVTIDSVAHWYVTDGWIAQGMMGDMLCAIVCAHWDSFTFAVLNADLEWVREFTEEEKAAIVEREMNK